MYSILELTDESYDCIVLMNTKVSPEEILEDIEYDLKFMFGNECSVLFDLLLYRGDSGARFLETVFDGKKIDKDSFNSVQVKKKSNIRKVASDYYRENKDLLWDSELSDYQRQLILRGDFL